MNSFFKILGAVFVVTYLLLNYYIGLRTFQACKAFWPSLKPIFFWPPFLVIALAYILDQVFSLNNPVLKVTGSYWLAAFFYLLLFYLLIDSFDLLNSTFKLLPSWLDFWQSRKVFSLGLIMTLLILLIGSWVAQNPVLTRYDININKRCNVKDMKIVFISDLHIEALARTDYMETAARTITALQPDLILLGGDIVEGALDQAAEEKLERIIGGLQAVNGIYAVLGNHEYYGGQVEQITAYLEKLNIRVLRDAVMENAGGIYIAGREDYGGGHFQTGSRKPLVQILTGINPEQPLILLDHQPQDIGEAKKAGVDLMLSGHTHGGQLFPAQWVTKAMFVIDRGQWNEGNFNLIVSTGLGLWGPPLRTSARAEIVVIDLHFTEQ